MTSTLVVLWDECKLASPRICCLFVGFAGGFNEIMLWWMIVFKSDSSMKQSIERWSIFESELKRRSSKVALWWSCSHLLDTKQQKEGFICGMASWWCIGGGAALWLRDGVFSGLRCKIKILTIFKIDFNVFFFLWSLTYLKIIKYTYLPFFSLSPHTKREDKKLWTPPILDLSSLFLCLPDRRNSHFLLYLSLPLLSLL